MNKYDVEGKSVALLLSGGVDSSVAVGELLRLGVVPDCFYIKIGPEEDDDQWDCSSEEDMEMATAVARHYGCRFQVVDCHKEYWDRVARYTMDKVRRGYTPNPDVMCNRWIKFGAFNEKVGHDYDLIATGHYAQTETDEEGRKWLTTSPDPVKDQTDFLAQIYDWQLRKALFPIGSYTKQEVRRLADEAHLVSAHRRDSQGICFLGKIDYNEYVRRYLGENQGDVVEEETGKKIGTHKGLWFHTIGQRHGLGFGGGPWFVVGKDLSANILYVSRGYEPERAYKQDFTIGDFHFLTVPCDMSDAYIKIRHAPEFVKARITPLSCCYRSLGSSSSDDAELKKSLLFSVHAERPLQGVAPGQFCVVYDNRHHRCFGSGEIIRL